MNVVKAITRHKKFKNVGWDLAETLPALINPLLKIPGIQIPGKKMLAFTNLFS